MNEAIATVDLAASAKVNIVDIAAEPNFKTEVLACVEAHGAAAAERILSDTGVKYVPEGKKKPKVGHAALKAAQLRKLAKDAGVVLKRGRKNPVA